MNLNTENKANDVKMVYSQQQQKTTESDNEDRMYCIVYRQKEEISWKFCRFVNFPEISTVSVYVLNYKLKTKKTNNSKQNNINYEYSDI